MFKVCGLAGRGTKLLTCHIPKPLLYNVVWLVEWGKEDSKEGQSVFTMDCKPFRVGRTRTLTHCLKSESVLFVFVFFVFN